MMNIYRNEKYGGGPMYGLTLDRQPSTRLAFRNTIIPGSNKRQFFTDSRTEFLDHEQPDKENIHEENGSDLDEDAKSMNFQDLFKDFCSSSTIHGTYFWGSAKSQLSRLIWGFIVGFGIVSATLIIRSSFQAWKDNPVITAVMQIPIEKVNFPAITICPMDDSGRYGIVEEVINQKARSVRSRPEKFEAKPQGRDGKEGHGRTATGSSYSHFLSPFFSMLTSLLRNEFGNERTADPADCLLSVCQSVRSRQELTLATFDLSKEDCLDSCPERRFFERFFADASKILMQATTTTTTTTKDDNSAHRLGNDGSTNSNNEAEERYFEFMSNLIFFERDSNGGRDPAETGLKKAGRFGGDATPYERSMGNRMGGETLIKRSLSRLARSIEHHSTGDCTTTHQIDCVKLVADFRFVYALKEHLNSGSYNWTTTPKRMASRATTGSDPGKGPPPGDRGADEAVRPGTLAKMALSHLEQTIRHAWSKKKRTTAPSEPPHHQQVNNGHRDGDEAWVRGVRNAFRTYIDKDTFPELYAGHWLLMGRAGEDSPSSPPDDLPLTELAQLLSLVAVDPAGKPEANKAPDPGDVDNGTAKTSSSAALDFLEAGRLSLTAEWLKVMLFYMQPPHVLEEEPASGNGERMLRPVTNGAFPFCVYNSGYSDGIVVEEYGEHYCDSFQTTFNDHGLCHTYNNHPQGLEEVLRTGRVDLKRGGGGSGGGDGGGDILKVQGCGKNNGLQIILDNHKIYNLDPKGAFSKGYKVFVTLPGVVTSRLPFYVDPGFDGEHNFYLHGIHVIEASDTFREWNKDAKACYFPYDKNLTYFKHYSQDNCLMECKLKKVSKRCGCQPWYMFYKLADDDDDGGMGEASGNASYKAGAARETTVICGSAGNECFRSQMEKYKDSLTDRTECDCRNDCEMVHFFATLQREPFSTNVAERRLLFDRDSSSGRLANYLLDPGNVFTDDLSRNVSKMVHGLDTDAELAEERFRRDVAVLNFFFDTPIITQIRLELRTTIFDMISAVGGTLGLFTGVSVITFIEIFWWLVQFCIVLFKKQLKHARSNRPHQQGPGTRSSQAAALAAPTLFMAEVNEYGFARRKSSNGYGDLNVDRASRPSRIGFTLASGLGTKVSSRRLGIDSGGDPTSRPGNVFSTFGKRF